MFLRFLVILLKTSMSEKRQYEIFAFMILFLVQNFETCCGSYTCYKLSSGKDICFMLDASLRNFEESKTFCKNNGGSLLEIYYEEMQRLVEQFVKSKTSYLGNAWLNLVRTTSNEWVWGDEGSDKFLSYSNWDGYLPATHGSLNHAFMNSVYKWVNSYNPENASTICIQGNSETYWLGPENTSITTTTTKAIPAPTASSATTSKTTTTTTDLEKQSNNFTSSITTSATTTNTIFSQNTTTIFTPTTKSNFTSESSSSSSSSSTTTTSTPLLLSTTVPKTRPILITATESSSSAIGIGVGVGLGGLVLIIVSSLLIAKFVFHKEIPLPFKSSRSRKSPPHQTGSDVINGDYEYIVEKKLDERSPYAEVIMSDTPNTPSNSTLNYVGLKDLIQPNSASGVEEPSKADYGTSLVQTFGRNIYDNAV